MFESLFFKNFSKIIEAELPLPNKTLILDNLLFPSLVSMNTVVTGVE